MMYGMSLETSTLALTTAESISKINEIYLRPPVALVAVCFKVVIVLLIVDCLLLPALSVEVLY